MACLTTKSVMPVASSSNSSARALPAAAIRTRRGSRVAARASAAADTTAAAAPPATRRAALAGLAAVTLAAAAAPARAEEGAAAAACDLVEAPSGLKFCELAEGTGKEPAKGALIRAHYTGRLAANGKVFDSSYPRGRPLTFKVCAARALLLALPDAFARASVVCESRGGWGSKRGRAPARISPPSPHSHPLGLAPSPSTLPTPHPPIRLAPAR